MGVIPGFKSEDHRQRFEEGRARRRRGGPEAPVCGVPTRDGRPCGRVPVDGVRCTIHGGKRDAGVVMPDRAAKAARNRMSYLWRRDGAWIPGRTIDLSQFERAFREDILAAGIGVLTLAPAVSDKARWRWRRYRLDRRDELAWHQFVHVDLPGMIAAAGPPPPGWDAGGACPIDGLVPIIAEPPAPGSKRRLPGRPASGAKKAPAKRTKTSADLDVVCPAVPAADIGLDKLDPDEPDRGADLDADELAALLAPGSDIWPMLVKVPSESGRRRLAQLHLDRTRFPGDPDCWERWSAAVRAVERGDG